MRALLPVLGLAAAIALPAAAHHGWAGYLQADFQMQGAVQSAYLGNPHGVVKVRDSEGRVWDVVLGPPGHQQRAGLTDAALPEGASVTAYGHRHTDPQRFEMKTERLDVNGRRFDIYPDRL